MEDEEEVDAEYIRKSSSFVLDNVFQRKEEMKEELEKFQKDLDEEFDDIEEIIFVQNIISYMQWRLQERENAFRSLDIVEGLQKKPHLITHCNKILFYTESGKHYLSNKLSKELKNNDHFKQTRTKSEATAEIGYCYSRLGPKHHDRAVKLLKEAIANITPERNILWEFRLALTLRRQTHMFQMTTPEVFNPAEKKKEAASLLYGVLKFPTHHDYRYIKARALCELSKLLSKRNNLFKIIETDMEETEKITECWCFEEAIKLCPNYFFVLRDYGIYLRYEVSLKKSKDMLERAVQLKDTICSRHHLALTLKKIVEEANPRPRFGKKLQFPYSMDDRNQSKHDSYDIDESTLLREFDSLSVDAVRNVDILYERSKSTESVRSYKKDLKKIDTLAKSPSKFQLRKTSLKKDQPTYHHIRNQKEPHLDDQEGASGLKGTFISARKSPRYVCVSPDNPLLLKAVEHLQRAIEMSKEYDGTRYDLGLVYRMLDRLDDAVKCFSSITSSNCGNPSEYQMYVINAYEQQACCKLDLLARETDPEKKNELRYDVKECAWKALTIVSGVIAAIPLLKRTNQCYPTLKVLLQHEDNSFRTLKELAKLHELLDYDEESIEYYKEIIKEKKDATTLRELAQTYIKIKDFRNAIYTLSLLQRTLEVNISDKSLYVETCIKGAMHSLIKDDDLDMAKIRFTEAYKAIFSRQNVSTPRNEEDDTSLDVLVLDSCGIDDCCYQNFVTSSLESFVQLRFNVNAFPGCLVLKYLDKAMDRSHCILILQHESISNVDEKDKLIELAMENAFLNHQAKVIQIRKQEVKQYLPCCKEITLTCGPCDIVHTDSRQYLLKGNLFSNILNKLSEMFLRESVDY